MYRVRPGGAWTEQLSRRGRRLIKTNKKVERHESSEEEERVLAVEEEIDSDPEDFPPGAPEVWGCGDDGGGGEGGGGVFHLFFVCLLGISPRTSRDMLHYDTTTSPAATSATVNSDCHRCLG